MEAGDSAQLFQDLRLDTSAKGSGGHTTSEDHDGAPLHTKASDNGGISGAEFKDDNKYSGSEVSSGVISLLMVEEPAAIRDGQRQDLGIDSKTSAIDPYLTNRRTPINFDDHVTPDDGQRQDLGADSKTSPIDQYLKNRRRPINFDDHITLDDGQRQDLRTSSKTSAIDQYLKNRRRSINFVTLDDGQRQDLRTSSKTSAIDPYLKNRRTSINFDDHVTPDDGQRQDLGADSKTSPIDQYLKNRRRSINFDDHVTLDDGQRQDLRTSSKTSAIGPYLKNRRRPINFDDHVTPDDGQRKDLGADSRTFPIDQYLKNRRRSINFDDHVTPDDGQRQDLGADSKDSAIDQYLKNRRRSINFDDHVTLDSGIRQSMDEPLQKPQKVRPRGRSLIQAVSGEKPRSARAHSESDRTHYDPVTGQPLPKYTEEMAGHQQPHIGELRHPLLQSTVDDMARESQSDLTISVISQSTASRSSDGLRTPQDERDFFLSPTPQSAPPYPASYEETTQWQRNRRRWNRSIDGVQNSDFPGRVGSMRAAIRQSSRRSTSSSTKSPGSAASSWLKAFSFSNESAVESISPESEGQTIGDDYVLGRRIGFGGFSAIHEVTQIIGPGEQRKLAAKIVRKNVKDKSLEENEQFQADFVHEVELWRLLHHRHILPLESVWHTDEATYCFIPLNKGGTLFDLVRSNRSGVPTELAKQYSYQLAVALRYLHCDARVAHRDVKLENCLLDTTTDPGVVRLCDFGMAEWISDDKDSSGSGPPSPSINADRQLRKSIGPAETSSSAFAGGSLDYAAPETLRVAMSNSNERVIVSPAVDMWAYGVCAYTLVVGGRPFYHSFQPRITAAILAGDWNRKHLLEKGGQDAFELVENCLRIDPGARWDADRVLRCAWLKEIADANNEQDDGFGSDWKL